MNKTLRTLTLSTLVAMVAISANAMQAAFTLPKDGNKAKTWACPAEHSKLSADVKIKVAKAKEVLKTAIAAGNNDLDTLRAEVIEFAQRILPMDDNGNVLQDGFNSIKQPAQEICATIKGMLNDIEVAKQTKEQTKIENENKGLIGILVKAGHNAGEAVSKRFFSNPATNAPVAPKLDPKLDPKLAPKPAPKPAQTEQPSRFQKLRTALSDMADLENPSPENEKGTAAIAKNHTGAALIERVEALAKRHPKKAIALGTVATGIAAAYGLNYFGITAPLNVLSTGAGYVATGAGYAKDGVVTAAGYVAKPFVSGYNYLFPVAQAAEEAFVGPILEKPISCAINQLTMTSEECVAATAAAEWADTTYVTRLFTNPTQVASDISSLWS